MELLDIFQADDEVGFEIKFGEAGQVFEVLNFGDLVVGKVEDPQGVEDPEALDFGDLIPVQV